MTATDRQLVTYEEAAQRLGVSVRTVQRRVRGGQLATVSDNGRQLVVLPESVVLTRTSEPEASSMPEGRTYGSDPQSSSDNVTPTSRIAALEARVADLEADRDHWRTMAAKLSDTVASQQQMIQGQFLERVRTDGRMLEHAVRPAEAVPDMAPPLHRTVTPPRRSWTLRGLYRAWRGR